MTNHFDTLRQKLLSQTRASEECSSTNGLAGLSAKTTWRVALGVWRKFYEPAILISVVHTRGSSPRHNDAKMLVTAEKIFDTVGGGQMEFRVIEIARAILAKLHHVSSEQAAVTNPSTLTRRLERFPLGARAGQCCGGEMVLALELLDASDEAWIDALLCLENEKTSGTLYRQVTTQITLPNWFCVTDVDGSHKNLDAANSLFIDAIKVEHFPIAIFGAGHVGQALIHYLMPLSRQLYCIDSRENILPEQSTNELEYIQAEEPWEVLDDLPKQCALVILTHSHALDLEIVYHALLANEKHDFFPYIGVIGSLTKQRRFRQQLAMRGISETTIEKMICPIGMASHKIQSKLPAAMALSIAYELQVWYESEVAFKRTSFELIQKMNTVKPQNANSASTFNATQTEPR